MKKNLLISLLILIVLLLIGFLGFYFYNKNNLIVLKCTYSGTYSFLTPDDMFLTDSLDTKEIFFKLNKSKKIFKNLDNTILENYNLSDINNNYIDFEIVETEGTHTLTINRRNQEISGAYSGKNILGYEETRIYKGICEPYKVNKL